MNIRKVNKLFNYILVMFLLFISIFLFNNKTIEKENTKNNLKALDQEGQNYRLVTSADNVQVPVPKGYVASSIEGENYVSPEYQHTTNTYKGNYTELTWSSPEGEQYPWTQDNNGIWISGNQGIPNSTSTLESEEFDYIKGTTLTVNYTFSCGSGDYYDIELINLTNNTTQKIRSSLTGNTISIFDYTTSTFTYTMNDWATGRYKIKVVYIKNGSGDAGLDSGYIKTSTYFKEDENGEIIEIDQKTKIHDGGFVIYQLTDEELEIDPNGTSVIINDINKDTAQTTRNQYVWVPVPNVEDLVRTKVDNNGIMQFGQEYVFSNTLITKETNTDMTYYSEPRLVEKYDNTKYYLQNYSNIDKKRESFLNNMQEDYTRIIKSINKYKGYYIGRYETGDEIGYYKCSFIKPKIVRYNSNIGDTTWYESYKGLERLSGKTEKYVETGMICDTLWDYTLKWLNETDTRNYYEISDISGAWGNYTNNSFKYKLTLNDIEHTKPINHAVRTSTGGITEIIFRENTYTDSPISSNNIFDIAGNVNEWTRARSYDTVRRLRGGMYDTTSNQDPAFHSGNAPKAHDSSTGSRCELLIR